MMKLRSIAAAAAFLGAVAVPGAATAATAFVVTNLNMRAGPSTAYPVVAAIGAGNTVEVYGCLSDYSWCDASIGPSRGWVAGRYLEYVYQSRRVLIPSYGPTIGLPVISFTFGSYWDRYYSSRPFYRERDRYREIRRERREDRRRERIEDRQERREEPQRRVEQPRRDQPARRDVIEQRRGERQEQRQEERRSARQEYRRCINGGGTPEQCGQ